MNLFVFILLCIEAHTYTNDAGYIYDFHLPAPFLIKSSVYCAVSHFWLICSVESLHRINK